MAAILCLVLAIITVACSQDIPIPVTPPTETRIEEPSENGTLGCGTVDDVTLYEPKNDTDPMARYGIPGIFFWKRWDKFRVYVDPEFSDSDRRIINDAMYNLHQEIPCIEFSLFERNHKPWGDYVHIKDKQVGCASEVGKMGGAQPLFLNRPGCVNLNTVMHEMMHALGFQHEQCAFDRDNYINIYWENMYPHAKHNFDKYNILEVTNFDIPYNTRSIMHYPSYDYSRNGKPVMLAKDGSTVGSQGKLAESDKQRLKKMYPCRLGK